MIQGPGKEIRKVGKGGIGIGKRLKIGDVGAGRSFSFNPFSGCFDLSGYIRITASAFCKITGAAFAAENAAACSKGSVSVWAGHAAVQRKLVNAGFELLFQRITESMVGTLIP